MHHPKPYTDRKPDMDALTHALGIIRLAHTQRRLRRALAHVPGPHTYDSAAHANHLAEQYRDASAKRLHHRQGLRRALDRR